MNALLSIKPEFADKILSGEKRYEFRRTTFRDIDAVDYVYLYASSPSKRIVGIITVNRIIEAKPTELWELFGHLSGIDDRERFLDYFEDAETGYAIEINRTHRFETPLNPHEIFDDFVPPVSFNYLDNEEEMIIKNASPDTIHNETAELPQFSSD